MMRFHQLGFIVKKGKCKVAYYDVLENKVGVIPSLDWESIKSELCTNAEMENLKHSWENNAEFSWNDCFSKIRGKE